MHQDVRTSEDFDVVSPADERQLLLPTDNINAQHLYVNQTERHDRHGDAQPGKDSPAPLSSAPSLHGEQLTRSNVWKLCAISLSFFVVGMGTSASGVCGSNVQISP